MKQVTSSLVRRDTWRFWGISGELSGRGKKSHLRIEGEPYPAGKPLYQFLMHCVGKNELLNCDVHEGVLSSDLPHLANISYRLRRELHFNGAAENL
jgi:hypothetical protein